MSKRSDLDEIASLYSLAKEKIVSKVKKLSVEITVTELGELLDETNALKRAVRELSDRGTCAVSDLVELKYLAFRLLDLFKFQPQDHPDSGEPAIERDFVFPIDPRAHRCEDGDEDDDEDDDESTESNGDLH